MIDQGTYGYETAALAAGRSNPTATAIYFAKLLGRDVPHPVRTMRFTLEELLAIFVARELEEDFRTWLLATIPEALFYRIPPALVIWPNDELGPGPWLAATADSLEDGGATIIGTLVDLATARAELEEVLSC